MKKSLLLAVLMLAAVTVSFAQNQGGQNRPQREGGERPRMTIEERSKQLTEQMKKELKLTDKQIAPVDSVNLLYMKAQQLFMQAAREGDIDREAMMEKFTELEKEKTKSLEAILSKDQMKAYEKWMEEMRTNRRRPDGQRPAGGQRPQNN